MDFEENFLKLIKKIIKVENNNEIVKSKLAPVLGIVVIPKTFLLIQK